MLVHFNGFIVANTTPVSEVHQSLRAVGSPGEPYLLGYTSVARANPYQALMYRALGDHGVAAAPILRGHSFKDLSSFAPLVRGHGIHFHWLSWALAMIDDPKRARTLSDGLLARVDRYRAGGGKVVFTVHNLYPHDARHVEAELHLQQGVVDRCDAVHVMTPSTVDYVSDYLTIDPDRVVVAPHPNYDGAYENYVSRADARQFLGLNHDDIVFVLFGALKAYKGLLETVSAFRLLRERHPSLPLKLLIAGSPDGHPVTQEFVDECAVEPHVLLMAQKVPANYVQIILNAADVGVVPYLRTLNSGAALLYLTFGLPVVATDTPVLRESLPAQHSVFVEDPTDPESLASAMEDAVMGHVGPRHREGVRESISHLHSAQVSRDFARALLSRLDWEY